MNHSKLFTHQQQLGNQISTLEKPDFKKYLELQQSELKLQLDTLNSYLTIHNSTPQAEHLLAVNSEYAENNIFPSLQLVTT